MPIRSAAFRVNHFPQVPALSHAQGHHLFISAQSFAGYKSLLLDCRPSRSIHIRHERRRAPVHEIGREQNQNTAMEFLILAIKILITEQKVNFLDTVCHICEKIERWLMQHR